MPPTTPHWQPQTPRQRKGYSYLALALTASVALIASVVAAAAWFRVTAESDANDPTPQFSEQEIADAKQEMCQAWNKTYRAIRSTGEKSDTDPNHAYLVAVNTRLAFHASADYLIDTLREQPAVPSSMAADVKKLASAYYDTAISQLGNAPQSEFKNSNEEMDEADAQLYAACR